MFYSQDIGEIRFDLSRNIGGRSNFIPSSERPNSNLSDPWKFELGECSNWAGQCQGPTFTLANDVARRTPYTLQWLTKAERQLGQNTTVEFG